MLGQMRSLLEPGARLANQRALEGEMVRTLYYSGPLVDGVLDNKGICGSRPYGLAKLDAGIEPEDMLRSLLKFCWGPFYTKREAYTVARYQGATGALLEFSFKMEV